VHSGDDVLGLVRLDFGRECWGFGDGVGIGDWSIWWGCRMLWYIVMQVLSLPEDGILDDERGPHKNSGYKKHYK
jgi:hypothetical protein